MYVTNNVIGSAAVPWQACRLRVPWHRRWVS